MSPSAGDNLSDRSRLLDVTACVGLAVTVTVFTIVAVTAATPSPAAPYDGTQWLLAIWKALPTGWTLLALGLAVVTLGVASAACDRAIAGIDNPVQRGHDD